MITKKRYRGYALYAGDSPFPVAHCAYLTTLARTLGRLRRADSWRKAHSS